MMKFQVSGLLANRVQNKCVCKHWVLNGGIVTTSESYLADDKCRSIPNLFHSNFHSRLA